VKNVLGQWGQEFVEAKLAPLVDGVWRCELDRDIYILKRRTNRTRVWEEYDLLQWLKDSGQPISLLLRTQEGVPWAEAPGGFYILYPYLQGTPGNELGVFSGEHAGEMGRGLARLHQALAAYQASDVFPGFDLFHDVASYAWKTVRGYSGMKFHHRLHHLQADISEQLVNPYEALPRQLIHRDFHPGNLIFVQGQLGGILDFDRVRIGIRLFDLCYLSTAVLSSGFSDPRKREDWVDFVQALLEAYGTVQPLEKTEGHAFLYIIYLIQLLFTAYHLDNGNSTLADLNLAMLFWIYDQHDYLRPRLEKSAAGQF
jgi:Ser/Thr protein kinase RdoA (MazF antagonist)